MIERVVIRDIEAEEGDHTLASFELIGVVSTGYDIVAYVDIYHHDVIGVLTQADFNDYLARRMNHALSLLPLKDLACNRTLSV